MSPRGAGLRVLHLQPGHPSRDANALHPPLLRGITVTQPGCLCPSRGLSHHPPPRKGAASPQDPQFCPKEGTQTQTLSWKRDARMPLLELVPAHPPHS